MPPVTPTSRKPNIPHALMTTPAQLFDIDSHTDPGNVRPLNEDAIAESFMASQGYMVLADGMGGHNAGDIASHYTVNTLNQRLEHPLKLQTESLLVY